MLRIYQSVKPYPRVHYEQASCQQYNVAKLAGGLGLEAI